MSRHSWQAMFFPIRPVNSFNPVPVKNWHEDEFVEIIEDRVERLVPMYHFLLFVASVHIICPLVTMEWFISQELKISKVQTPWSLRSSLNRDFKVQRRGRQRERQKNNRFYTQNNNCARASRFFVYFLARYTTTSWKGLISRFMEDINKQRRNFISLFELGYGPWEFNSRRVPLHLTSG